MKRARKGGAEQDCFSKYWRKVINVRRCSSKIKKGANRRERRQARYRELTED